MGRFLMLAYGFFCYAVGMAGLSMFVLFVGDWNAFVIHSDADDPNSLLIAVPINSGLMILFALQHSLMARQRFKQVWIRLIPQEVERSTYVLFSGAVLLILCLCWRRIAGTAWHVDNAFLRAALTAMQVCGWGWAVVSSFLINHLELVGLQQVYCKFTSQPEPKPMFHERSLYKLVRHPLQLGILAGIWCAPTMTLTHLMLSAAMTVYIFVGLYFEEKDLLDTWGQAYESYQKRVPMILPIPKRMVRTK